MTEHSPAQQMPKFRDCVSFISVSSQLPAHDSPRINCSLNNERKAEKLVKVRVEVDSGVWGKK